MSSIFDSFYKNKITFTISIFANQFHSLSIYYCLFFIYVCCMWHVVVHAKCVLQNSTHKHTIEQNQTTPSHLWTTIQK